MKEVILLLLPLLSSLALAADVHGGLRGFDDDDARLLKKKPTLRDGGGNGLGFPRRRVQNNPSMMTRTVRHARALHPARPLTKPCRMILDVGSTSSIWTCEVDPDDYFGEMGHVLPIDGLSDEDLQQVSGTTFMTAEGAFIRDYAIVIPSDVTPSFEQDAMHERRRRLQTTGAHDVLALRIVANDTSSTATVAQLEDDCFDDTRNLVDRYASCSFGKLTMSPYSGTLNGVTIPNGAYEVTIPHNVAGQDYWTVTNWAVTQLNSDLGATWLSNMEHVMYMLPPGVTGCGFAKGQWPGKYTWYADHCSGFSSAHVSSILF